MGICANCGAEMTGAYCTQCGVSAGGTSRTRQRSGKPVLKWVLIVFGILVALFALAALIAPLTISNYGPNEAGVMDAELDTVQISMDIMMTEKGIAAVKANDTILAVNTWQAFPIGPGAVPLSNYLREKSTLYYYCWDAAGKVWQRNDPGKNPTRKSAKKPGKCSPLPKSALPTNPPRK